MKTSSVSLVVLTTLLLAVPARAQNKTPAADTPDEAAGRMKKNYQELIKRHDKNGDGRLDEAERAAAEKFRAEQVRKFDQDGDGQLNDAERKTAHKALLADQPASQRKKDR